MKTEDVLKTAGQTAVGSGAVVLGVIGTAAIYTLSPVITAVAVIGGGGYALGQYMFGECEEETVDDE